MSAVKTLLLVVPTWMRDGGVSAHVQASAAVLSSRGLDVHVVAARVDDDGLPGVTIHRSPELFDVGAPAESRLAAAMSIRPDVVHFHQVDDPDLVDRARSSAAAVISIHVYTACTSGLYFLRPGRECHRSHGVGCLGYLATRQCSPGFPRAQIPGRFAGRTRRIQALRRADMLISYSRAVDRHLAANGLNQRRIVPLFTTVSAERASREEGARRSILFAGRIVKAKGLDVLLHAARSVDAEFTICGEGHQLDNSRALAERLGIASRVRFLGWLAPEQLARELADSAVVVVPSVWPEPFGLVGIEALAAGRPVVASATGGIVDWLEHGVNGLCVPPDDPPALARALNELLDDPSRQHAMGAAGRQMVAERFSPERHAAALLDCYETAIRSWGAGAPGTGAQRRLSPR